MMRRPSSARTTARNHVAMIAFAAVAMLGASVADAEGRGVGRPNGGRMAQASVSGANHANRNDVRRSGQVSGNRNNVGSGNRNNINIGNDVNIDIDHDYNHGNEWNDHHHHPIAAGIVIGTVAVTTAAVVGSYYYRLPAGCTMVYRNGVSYYYCGSVYYSRTWYGNDVVYVVVNP